LRIPRSGRRFGPRSRVSGGHGSCGSGDRAAYPPPGERHGPIQRSREGGGAREDRAPRRHGRRRDPGLDRPSHAGNV